MPINLDLDWDLPIFDLDWTLPNLDSDLDWAMPNLDLDLDWALPNLDLDWTLPNLVCIWIGHCGMGNQLYFLYLARQDKDTKRIWVKQKKKKNKRSKMKTSQDAQLLISASNNCRAGKVHLNHQHRSLL